MQLTTTTMPTPRLDYLFTLRATLGASFDAGTGPLGRRVLDQVAAGSFDGPRLRGELLAGSGDWRLIRRDGVSEMDVRAVLRTDDGAIVHMRYGGRVVVPDDVRSELADVTSRHLVDPSRYSIRTAPTFETGAPAYAWLNDLVCVGTGRLSEGGVTYDVHQVC